MLHAIWSMGVTGGLRAMDSLLEWAASKYAIAGYLALLIGIIAVLVVLMLVNNGKDSGGDHGPVVIQAPPEGTPTPTVIAVASKASADGAAPEAEENAPRFCMLSRIDESNTPAPFRGLAVTLIAASFISLAFMGFGGIVENIFG